MENKKLIAERNMTTLVNLLKGFEGKSFYCSLFGKEVELRDTTESSIKIGLGKCTYILRENGEMYEGGECILWPSKDQRDWEKWEKTRIYDTWEDVKGMVGYYLLDLAENHDENPIDSKVSSLFKIMKIIELGYGKDNSTTGAIIVYDPKSERFMAMESSGGDGLIDFPSLEEASRFISKKSNVELLKKVYEIK